MPRFRRRTGGSRCSDIPVKIAEKFWQVDERRQPWITPIISRPRCRLCMSATTRARSWRHSHPPRLRPRKAWPACVRLTRLVVRSNSAVPISSSRARIEAESPDWTICSRAAARVNAAPRPPATKCSSCRRSNFLSGSDKHPMINLIRKFYWNDQMGMTSFAFNSHRQ